MWELYVGTGEADEISYKCWLTNGRNSFIQFQDFIFSNGISTLCRRKYDSINVANWASQFPMGKSFFVEMKL